MTLSRGFRGDAGYIRRTAAQVIVAALVITAVFAALWAGPAAAASGRGALARAAASPAAKRVKFYIVPQPGNGPAVALYGIAARTLGDTHRYIEIFKLNKGRLQPDGNRLENPRTIDPGWILRLPADASGPGVRFGRLPKVTRSATAPASHRPSQPASNGAAAARSRLGSTGTGSVIVVGGALILLLGTAGLAVGLRRRRAGAQFRQDLSGTRESGPPGSVRTGAAATSPDIRATDPRWPGADPRRQAAGPRRPAAEHPSFPGADPRFYGAEHPSFPGADYPGVPGADPRWPGADPRRPAAEHPSFPGADYPGFPGGDPRRPGPDAGRPRGISGPAGPRRESPPEPHYNQRPRAASPPAAATVHNPPGSWGSPPGGGPDGTQLSPAPVARTPGTAIQTYQDVGFGDNRLQVVLSDAPAVGWERATGLGARAEDMLQLADPLRPGAGAFRDAQYLWLAGRILSGAENQAAEIRHEARDQAAEARAIAEREAAEIRQQATAARAIAEQEAAEIRASAMTMSTELGRVAAYVTESLTSPSIPAIKPAARPATKPATRRATKPATRPAAKPAGRPAAKPNGRQVKAMRKMVVALVVVCLVGGITGASEIGLHGFGFFLFRNTGAGAGNSQDLDENQGPGQPDAPGAHPKTHQKTHPSSKPTSKPSKSN